MHLFPVGSFWWKMVRHLGISLFFVVAFFVLNRSSCSYPLWKVILTSSYLLTCIQIRRLVPFYGFPKQPCVSIGVSDGKRISISIKCNLHNVCHCCTTCIGHFLKRKRKKHKEIKMTVYFHSFFFILLKRRTKLNVNEPSYLIRRKNEISSAYFW